MKIRTFLKPITLLSGLLVGVMGTLPVTAEAGSRGYDSYQDYNRRGQRSYNYRRQDRALDFYYGGNRNRGRYIDYNRGYRPSDEYCPDNSYSGYRDRGRGRRDYQRPRGFGIFYYGKQR